MYKKIYKYEIILNLLNKKENHIRQIAKDLTANAMTIKLELDKLTKGNILNVKEEGKNNVFSIKNTLEARYLIYSSEQYKIQKFLFNNPIFKNYIKELLKLESKMIILFGSYAKEIETKDSDIDIYIETNKKIDKNIIKEINSKINIKTGKFDLNNLLIKEIIKNHIIIKGVERFYEKNKFFKEII